MQIAEDGAVRWLPSIAAILVTILIVVIVRFVESKIWSSDVNEQRFRKQVYTFGLLFVGMLVAIFLLPEGSNQELAFSVIGLVVTGALAISSQSIIANGMAGLLLRSLKKFKPGDFIEVSDRVGRVTELGLFHTEIQTNDRDLTTIPNALMVNQPVKVVRSSGTIVSATISIGYDVGRHELKPLFLDAATRAELVDPFMQVVELGDYSVVYRVAGFLDAPERLLATRSKLQGAMLDALHEAKVEIMSPMFVATRNTDDSIAIPHQRVVEAVVEEADPAEDRTFDKAEMAGGIQAHRKAIAEAEKLIETLQSELGTAGAENDDAIRQRIEAGRKKIQHLLDEIEDLKEVLRSDD